MPRQDWITLDTLGGRDLTTPSPTLQQGRSRAGVRVHYLATQSVTRVPGCTRCGRRREDNLFASGTAKPWLWVFGYFAEHQHQPPDSVRPLESKMLRKVSTLLSAALPLLLALCASDSAKAQAGPVAIGHGTFQALTRPTIIDFTFVVAEAPDGSSRGFAIFGGFAGPGSLLVMRVTSHMRIGATALFAGPIIANVGNDPHAQVGQTAFTAVNDNGCGTADQIASLSIVPAPYGNPTIQQIVGLIGPPTAASFTPVLSGNIWAR